MIELENLFPALAAGGSGLLFGELTLRSWRELAQIILHRRSDRRNNTTAAQIEDPDGHRAIQTVSDGFEADRRDDNLIYSIEPPPPGGIFRFLLLKGGAVLMLAVLLQWSRANGGFNLLLVFLGAYVVYLFLRGWSMRPA